MKIRSAFLGVFILLCNSFAIGQKVIAPIEVGNKLPNQTIQYCIGDSAFTSNIDDYRGKLLIIDFWTTTCTSCLTGMNKMAELQRVFSDKIKILLVTSDSRSKVISLFDRVSKKKGAPDWVIAAQSLSMVYDDTLLKKLFPHDVFPVHIWVDTLGYLISKNYSYSTTYQNISSYFQGKKIFFDEQKVIDLNVKSPLSWANQINNISSYTLFFKGIEYGKGFSKSYLFLKDSITRKEVGMSCLNLPIIDLYKLAYKDWRPTLLNEIPANRIHIETKDSSKYFLPSNDEQQAHQWFLDHSYCFALRLSPERHAALLQSVRFALDQYLGIESKLDSVTVPCYILKVKPGVVLASTNKGPEVYEREAGHLLLKNARVMYLYFYLENVIRQKLDNLPLLDETGLKSTIDLEFYWQEDIKESRLSSLIAAMEKKGLLLVKENRCIPMLVLQDK